MTIARDATATMMTTNRERGKPSSVTAEGHPIESTLVGNHATMGGMAEGMMMAAMTTVIKGGIMMGGMEVGIMTGIMMRVVVGEQRRVVDITTGTSGAIGSNHMTGAIKAEVDLGVGVIDMISTVGVDMITMIIGIKAEEGGI